MQTLKFIVKEQIIYTECMDRILIAGSRSYVNSSFELDTEWDGLTVTALFENDVLNGRIVQVLLTSDTVEVPPEVLVTGRLRVGLVGLGDGGAVRMTTKRMSGAIPVYQCGGTGGEDAEEMTPELWEQAIAAIGPLGALETADKSNLVAAINEARQTGGGGAGGTNDHTKLSNRDAADQHPIGAITGLEAALDGKQPTGSYLTGKDIDATITMEGKAADAKAVGDAIRSLSEEIVTTSESKVDAHNTGTDTHSDIRLLIKGLTDRLNALADSDDTTLDQLSEVVAYIKSNRSLIEAITTSKVSVADIIDNLTTNVTNKPLSAAQGVALKALIDGISVPDKLPNPNALTFSGAVTGSYDGSAPLSVEIPSGGGGSSGGSGKAKSQILIDQEITELTSSLSVTLEHDFHNLTAIISCGSAGAALTADSDGTAVESKIGLLIDTTDFRWNSRKVAFTDTSKGTWRIIMFGAEWSDDLSVFKRSFAAEITTNTGNKSYTFPFGGSEAMYGTLGTDDNAPRTGRTANIVVNGAYLNVGTRVVLWGEYYE